MSLKALGGDIADLAVRLIREGGISSGIGAGCLLFATTLAETAILFTDADPILYYAFRGGVVGLIALGLCGLAIAVFGIRVRRPQAVPDPTPSGGGGPPAGG